MSVAVGDAGQIKLLGQFVLLAQVGNNVSIELGWGLADGSVHIDGDGRKGWCPRM